MGEGVERLEPLEVVEDGPELRHAFDAAGLGREEVVGIRSRVEPSVPVEDSDELASDGVDRWAGEELPEVEIAVVCGARPERLRVG